MKPVDVPAWSPECLARFGILSMHAYQRRLDEVATDAERRDRNISITRWNAAPSPPTTKRECMTGQRPCPAVRCWFHCGDRGDGTVTCVLDVEAPMTTAAIASVTGVSRQRAEQNLDRAERSMRDSAIATGSREFLIALRVFKRHA